MTQLAWLIPVFPLLSFVKITFFSRKLKEKSAICAIINMAFSFALSVPILLEVIRSPHAQEFSKMWMKIGGTVFSIGYLIDPLSAMMLFVVTLVSLLIHIYSVGYMHGDPRYPRFFSYLSLFTAAMLALVLSNNLIHTYVSWELVGLCSYLLIGFWFEKPSAMRAAKKAFMVTRVGDVGLFFGIMLLFTHLHTVNFLEIFEKIKLSGGEIPAWILTVSALCIFMGAAGKSAQFPLHVWLPDAMEGPTPVSALIHAATMVAAGVFLVARMFTLFDAAGTPLVAVAHIGALTALMAATIAVVTNDIKRVLAYSTISQLGYMMMALGVGGFAPGTFHLMTHAFFKALLFLGAGSVFHAAQTYDLWQMGGLRKHMRITTITFIIGSLALAGIPPLAGFWSKDEILLEAYHFAHEHGYWVPFIFGVGGAFLTAFYMTRLCCLAFLGDFRGGAASEHGHGKVHLGESPLSMTVPLVVLSVFSIVAGLPGSPLMSHGFQTFIHKSLPHASHKPVESSIMIMMLSIGVALLGIITGGLIYGRKNFSALNLKKSAPFSWLYHLLKNKYYMDEILYFIFVRPMFLFASIFSRIDQKVVDGTVNAVGWLTLQFSYLQNLVDKYIVDGMVNLAGWLTKVSGNKLRYVQTGLVQGYMMMALIGIFILALFVTLFS